MVDPPPRFGRYVGIDYSGAAAADEPLSGLAAVEIHPPAPARIVRPSAGPVRRWSRRSLHEWLTEGLAGDVPTLVGIDHGFSFPEAYFERHGITRNWDELLDFVHRHWPTDRDGVSVEDVRRNRCGKGPPPAGDSRWRRACERRSGSAKSVFHFDVQGSVAKSTHAGLPWLCNLRRRFGAAVHVWPFDGWTVPEGVHCVAEVYPRLWNRTPPAEGRTPDEHDAWCVAEALRAADRSGALGTWFAPQLEPAERSAAACEGWILGLT
ncbi:MAG: hypothetical protein GC161_12695 [Planctomycetaceae bacterium]|nr:hypothetical protein [Planctomycetaceae bacterium]